MRALTPRPDIDASGVARTETVDILTNPPLGEEERLAELESYQVLDTEPEQTYDDLTRLAASICGTPVGLISLVDRDRQWFKSRIGFEMTETPRNVAFCHHAIMSPEPMIVPDATSDPRFVDNPLVTKGHIRFYGGVPISSPRGLHLGAVCVMDYAARTLRPDQIDALRAISRQITQLFELRRHIAGIQQKSLELEAAHAEAERASQAKTAFLAMVSHEIRTPMNGILGTANLLHDTPLNAEQQEYVRILRSSSKGLLSILDDVLDISKMEAGQFQVEQTSCDLADILHQVHGTFRPVALEKLIHLKIQLDPGAPRRVISDPVRIRQLLSNLLSNALKFTPPHGCVMAVIGAETDWSKLHLVVQDSGVGIPQDMLGQIFHPFVQADVSTTRRFGGTGLGLTICQQIVNLMGGEISLSSEINVGTRFDITLPLVPDLQAVEANAAAAPSTAPLPPLRILLAEDNPVNQCVAHMLLSKLGHSIRVAHDGREAVDLLATERFDVVLMDCRMPEMDGFEAARRVRERERSTGFYQPIVALTASAYDQDRQACIASGMDGFVSKPFDKDLLIAELRRVLTLCGTASCLLDDRPDQR